MSVSSPNLTIKPAFNSASIVEGIYPDDLIIKSTLEIGLQELRNNSTELALVFGGFTKDPRTRDLYGEKEQINAINWFSTIDIPVLWDLKLTADRLPSITYSIQASDEQEYTLSDLHYQTEEGQEAEWEPLTPVFNPIYDRTTGIVTATLNDLGGLSVSAGMFLVTRTGFKYPILDVVDDTRFVIASNTMVNLNGSHIKGDKSRLVSKVQSSNFKEIVKIGCHVGGDPIPLTYLHAVCSYILLKYRKDLLEARGFERTTISSGPAHRDERFPTGSENVFTRYITVVGYVRNTWTGSQSERVESVGGQIEVGQAGVTTENYVSAPDDEDPAWLAADVLGR